MLYLCLVSILSIYLDHLTNFVLLEWSQPSHAFDLDVLVGKKIVVRRARSTETLKTLDSLERKLDERDLVIADGEKPQVLAGCSTNFGPTGPFV